MEEIVAEVLINRPSKHLNRTFTYRIPKKFSYIDRGWFVIVPFARRMESGFVLRTYSLDVDDLTYVLRFIEDVPDSFPWFTPKMLSLARWVSSYYLCTLLDALRLFLIDKKGIKTMLEYKVDWDKIPYDSNIRANIDTSVQYIRKTDAEKIFCTHAIDTFLKLGYFTIHEKVKVKTNQSVEPWIAYVKDDTDNKLSRSPKQRALFELLKEKREIPLSDLSHYGFSQRDSIYGLTHKELAKILYKRKRTYSLVGDRKDPSQIIHDVKTLTEEQTKAVQQINQWIDEGHYHGALVHGVTGSGKTEVYLRAAEHALSLGGSVLILVPEIALTSQMVQYFSERFGSQVVFMHSGLSKGERFNNRLRIMYKESRIIIGSRSSLFLPFSDLKLIVVDEEYDSSYKQDQTPRYNGRDVAKKMALLYDCPLVLGAATPSITTYYAAEHHIIDKIELKNRVFHTPLPAVHIVDMKTERAEGNSSIFSRPLLSLLQKTLDRHKKSILMLNRRGYSTALMCKDCGYVFKCPHCDIPLVFHKGIYKLRCHYCESSYPIPQTCPKCGSHQLLFEGTGTEKVGEELQEFFPHARIQRFDLDSTQRKNILDAILNRFRDGEIDILFGTQMVAKGLDIPNVQAVGILSADGMLNIPSYRASEQAFSLMTQCAGRAGREKEQGEVILQTYNPDQYVIQAARRQDYISFYERELSFRKHLGYPPFQRLMKITFFSSSYQAANSRSNEMYQFLKGVQPKFSKHPLTITPPFDEPIRKLRDKYQISIMIRGERLSDLKTIIQNSALFNRNGIIIDVDPM